MAKKLCSYRLLSGALAVLAVIAFIVACGGGDLKGLSLEEIGEIEQSDKQLSNFAIKDNIIYTEYSNRYPSSSSKEEEESSSSTEEEPNPPDGESSSSQPQQQNSSSSAPPKSSSSSSEPKSTLTCEIVKKTIAKPASTDYPPDGDRPVVKCTENGKNPVTMSQEDIEWNGIQWTKGNPAAGKYENIKVKIYDDADAKICLRMEATCTGGPLTVTGPSSSSVYVPPPTPSSSSVSGSGGNSSSSRSSSSNAASSSSVASSGGTCGSDGKGDNCLWNGAGDCWPIKDQADRTNCGKNAWIFSGGTTGAGALCKGGTFICGKDSSPPSGGAASLGCCKWDTETKCWDIYTAKEKEDCSGGSNKFKASACPDKEGTCPTF